MQRVTLLLPTAALGFGFVAYLWPEPFAALQGWIAPLLALVMFGMGMTLQASSFVKVFRRPGVIFLGVLLQYSVMPLAAWAISRILELPPLLLVGMVLVGASPGGTASNVICYLARGDVALSISLTTVSTVFAVVATPLLTLIYAGQAIAVPTVDIFVNVLKIVVIPVIVGTLINQRFHARLAGIKHWFPYLSIAAIVAIIAIVIALNVGTLAGLALTVLIAVVLHNAVGLLAGYIAASAFGLDCGTRRTLAIEVGMQNSGLAASLAVAHFSTTSALPGAVFSVWHNLTGAILAAWWSRRSAAD